MKPQWEKRLDITTVIYQFILLDMSRDDVINSGFVDYEFDASQMNILEYSVDHYQEIVDAVTPFLEKTWRWDRMNYFDRAIIVESIAESRVADTPKKVIIDQALITARKYNIDDSYKYINAILDKVIQ